MKSLQDIKILLERYWEGETSLEEERMLKNYFSEATVAPELQREAAYFRALFAEQQVLAKPHQPKRFALRPMLQYAAVAASVLFLLAAGFYWWETTQPAGKLVTPAIAQQQPVLEIKEPVKEDLAAVVQAPQKTLQAQVSKPRPVRRQQPSPPQEPDTYEDPEQALAEIKAALALVSSKISKSKQTLDKGLQEVDRIDILFKKRKEKAG